MYLLRLFIVFIEYELIDIDLKGTLLFCFLRRVVLPKLYLAAIHKKCELGFIMFNSPYDRMFYSSIHTTVTCF